MSKIDEQVWGYLNYCEKVRRMTPATMGAKKNVLKRFVMVTKIRDVGELTNEVFNKWVESEIDRGVSAVSVNAYDAVVVAMVRYCRGMGVEVPINLALVRKLREGRSRRSFYTEAEIRRVVARADLVTGLQIQIMFDTGMRIAELVGLKVGDFEGRRVRFVGKGRKPREAYIREETRAKLERYIIENGVTEFLWVVYDGVKTINGEPPTVNTVRERLRRPFRAAGYADFYPHALRHSFATDLQLKGASVEEIKEMIGHESIATTERYLHGFEGRLMELFEKYK